MTWRPAPTSRSQDHTNCDTRAADSHSSRQAAD
jgi:hypothetical protein